MGRKVLIIITAVIFIAASAIVLDYFHVPGKVMAKASSMIGEKIVATPTYTLVHSGSQGTVTDPAQCMIYGKFTNNNGSTGSLNYRVYIDDVFAGTFASASGGSYKINLNSTCVQRFGDNMCVNFQTKFTHNIAHSIKIQVNVNNVWEYADDNAPFPKSLTCQDANTTLTPIPTFTRTPTKTSVPPTATAVPPTKTPTPTKIPTSNQNYTLSHLGSQGTITDPTQCKIYGKLSKNAGSTGSLNYRVYIDDVFSGTFATSIGGNYEIDLNSTCVKRFGDNKCVDFRTKFTHNVPHTIKIQVNLGDEIWEYADDHTPFPKTLTCQDVVVPTPTATSTLTPYKLQDSVMYTTNFAYPDLGCNWMGIAGQVLDKSGNPLTNMVVTVEGVLGSAKIDLIDLTGLATTYGPGGYEIQLSNKPMDSKDTLTITVYDLAGFQISDSVKFSTFNDCTKNLIIANFTSR